MGTFRRLLGAAAVLLLILAGLTVGTGAAYAATCHPFKDVTSANPHCANIEWLEKTGMTKPADELFHPEDSVTRGQMAAFLYRFDNRGEAQPACDPDVFGDVDSSNLFCGYISWAAAHHITFGDANGNYRPDDEVTRAQMAAFLHRIVVGAGAPACTTAPAVDVATTDTFCSVISWMVATGMTTGIGCGYYGADWPVTRQAMATFLHRTAAGPGAHGPTALKAPTGCTPPVPPAEAALAAYYAQCPVHAKACVDLTTDQTWLQRGGEVVYGPVPMTSGRPGFRTNPGMWRVYFKDKHHFSGQFNSAPMPNSVFFDGGIAFHQGELDVLSHGCIHLSRAASQKYWDYLHLGDSVYVFGYADY